MTITPNQRRVLRNLADSRPPHYGSPLTGGFRSGVIRSLHGLERRGLAAKSHGRWVLTGDGAAVAQRVVAA